MLRDAWFSLGGLGCRALSFFEGGVGGGGGSRGTFLWFGRLVVQGKGFLNNLKSWTRRPQSTGRNQNHHKTLKGEGSFKRGGSKACA